MKVKALKNHCIKTEVVSSSMISTSTGEKNFNPPIAHTDGQRTKRADMTFTRGTINKSSSDSADQCAGLQFCFALSLLTPFFVAVVSMLEGDKIELNSSLETVTFSSQLAQVERPILLLSFQAVNPTWHFYSCDFFPPKTSKMTALCKNVLNSSIRDPLKSFSLSFYGFLFF